MIIRRIRFKEVCQFREIDVALTPGLNVIIGKNGSGKSNLVKNAYAAITNDWSRNVGGKAANICQLAAKRAASWVALDIEHASVSMSVERWLQSGKSGHEHRLRVGDKEVLSEAQVTATLLQQLGVSAWALDSLLFVNQGKMHSFLRETDAKRVKNFQQLFGLDWITGAWDWLGRQARETIAPPADIKAMEAEVQQCELRREELLAIERSWTATLPAGSSVEDRKLLQALVLSKQYLAMRQQGLQELQHDQQTLQQVENELRQSQEDLAILQEAEAQERPLAEQARQALARAQTIQKAKEARETAERSRSVLEASLARLLPPPRPLWLDETTNPAVLLSEMTTKQGRHQAFLAAYNPVAGADACPECGTPSVDLRSKREACQRELEQLRVRIPDLQRYITEDRNVQGLRQQHEQKLLELRSKLDTLGEQQEESVDETQQRQIVASHHQAHAAVSTMASHCAALRSRQDSLQAACRRSQTGVEHATAKLAELGPLAVEEEVQTRLAAREKAEQQIAAVHSELSGLVWRIGKLGEDLTLARAVAVRYTAARDWQDLVTRMRSSLDYDQLPRALLRECLRRIEEPAHEFLRMFDAPFSFVIDEKLDLTVTKVDGVKHSAGRLSDAQLLVLALSFRLALEKSFGAGFICLDEPTYGLDVDNRRNLEVVIERMRDYSAASGTQILLVTHEPELASRYDNLVDLGGGLR